MHSPLFLHLLYLSLSLLLSYVPIYLSIYPATQLSTYLLKYVDLSVYPPIHLLVLIYLSSTSARSSKDFVAAATLSQGHAQIDRWKDVKLERIEEKKQGGEKEEEQIRTRAGIWGNIFLSHYLGADSPKPPGRHMAVGQKKVITTGTLSANMDQNLRSESWFSFDPADTSSECRVMCEALQIPLQALQLWLQQLRQARQKLLHRTLRAEVGAPGGERLQERNGGGESLYPEGPLVPKVLNDPFLPPKTPSGGT